MCLGDLSVNIARPAFTVDERVEPGRALIVSLAL
jgi:hypothetical protein